MEIVILVMQEVEKFYLLHFLDTNLQESYYQEYIKHLIHSLHK